MRSVSRIVLLFLIVGLGCWGLPSDFAKFSLEEKVAAYEKHFRRGGARKIEAKKGISWHGAPAAEMMVPYILGEKSVIPPHEAISIVWDVQMRGCDLRGTRAEAAVQSALQAGKLDPSTALKAEDTLDAIREGSHMREGFDILEGGPCEKELGGSSRK
jgi:hypothetical protein